MDFERMSFRTPNYSDAIMDSLLKLQQGGVFCDAVLKGKDVEAKVHKVILMATDCEFFKEQMTKSDMGNTTENPCIVEIDTESQVDLDCLVKELYTGCLELTTSNVRNMFKIYETLKMNDQLKFCHQFENFLLRPPDPNKSSEFTGLDMLDESKVSAIVCEGSDIVQVIKEEVADDTDIRDILESSLKQTEILQGADIEMSDNENKTLKSEELKGEELSSGVQQWEVAQIAISEKGEGEQIASGGDGGSTEESQLEIENVDESTVKSENGDVEEDDMEGFEVVDEYIEDEQEENKEKINEAPPAKKLKIKTSVAKEESNESFIFVEENNQYCCKECVYSTRYKSYMKRHMKRHSTRENAFVEENSCSQKKPILCEQCEKSFKTRYGLSYHVNAVHKRFFKHTCSICNQGFVTKQQYRGHMSSHERRLKEKCVFCGQEFNFKSNLKYHVKFIHLKEKINCNIPGCDLTFTSTKGYYEHKRVVHNGILIRCKFCSKPYKWSSSLSHHVRTVHKKESQ